MTGVQTCALPIYPVALTKWIITDDIGNQTSVSLGELQTGQNFLPSLFSKEIALAKRSQ